VILRSRDKEDRSTLWVNSPRRRSAYVLSRNSIARLGRVLALVRLE